ncbi:MAG TPA: hypothetical protein VFF67_08525 [Thermoplasmata archaeon]|nr:hypothetical protein [Thermoplasmata archaeon]
MRIRHRRPRRGVSNLIAVILISGMTLAAGALLFLFRFNLPAKPVTVEYTIQGDQGLPAWGDPTDCTNQTLNATCDTLPAVFVVFTSHSPDNIPLSALQLTFICNQTTLLQANFQSLEVVPGTGANPGASAPHIANCGTWNWGSGHGYSGTYFNRLLYFQQLKPTLPVLANGDQLVVYIHPPADFCDRNNHCPDDDYHGVPPWCFAVPGDCTIYLSYTQNPVTLIASIPFTVIQA